MRRKKVLIIFTVIMAFMFSLSGCGGDTGEATEEGVAAEESVAAVAETVEQVVTEQIAEAVDTKSSVDDLVGSWIDIAAADRFVNITKEGAAYQYEDNEGKLPAEFLDGILKVKISDTETADVYIDTQSEHLLLVYQDNVSEFTKK